MLLDGEEQVDDRREQSIRDPLTLRQLARRRLRLTAGAHVLNTASIEWLPPLVARYILFEHRS